MKPIPSLIFSLMWTSVAGIAATDPPTPAISTDRPDFTESTDTVPAGAVQLEGGLIMGRHALEAGDSHQVGAPMMLTRLGITRFLELRLETDGYTRQSQRLNGIWLPQSGTPDIEVSAKVRLWRERRELPALAVIAGASIPTGSAAFSSFHNDPFLEMCWSKSLRVIDLGGNFNFRWNRDSTEHAVSISASRLLGRGIGAYTEVYRISPIEADEAAHWIANTGITRALGEHMQVDFEVGHTVRALTPYWFVGAGFVVQIPRQELLRALHGRV